MLISLHMDNLKSSTGSYCFTFCEVIELKITEAATRVHQIPFRATHKKSEQPTVELLFSLAVFFCFCYGKWISSLHVCAEGSEEEGEDSESWEGITAFCVHMWLHPHLCHLGIYIWNTSYISVLYVLKYSTLCMSYGAHCNWTLHLPYFEGQHKSIKVYRADVYICMWPTLVVRLSSQLK